MAASNVAVVKAEASQRIANARRNQRTKSMEQALVRHAAGITTAALFGTMNRMKVPVSIAGFPWKLGVAAIALLGEGLTKGSMQAACAGIGAATTAIYVERSISTDTMVAGGDASDGGGNY